MTTPDSSNEDWAPVKVKAGISEAVLALGFLSSILTSYFGHDWGISKNAQAIAGLGVLVMPTVLAIIRSVKHRGAQAANAAVAVARVHAAASVAAASAANPAPAVEQLAPPTGSRAARVSRAKAT